MRKSNYKIVSCLLLFTIQIFSQDFKKEFQNDSTLTASFSVVGDIMCHSTQFNYAQVSEDSFDFKPVFSKVKSILEDADFTIGNFETTTAGSKRGYSGYPAFNTPDEILEALNYAGFDLLIIANNHTLDTGRRGATRTAEMITRNGMNYNGAFFSKEDSDSIRIYNVNGLNVAVCSYTYGTNAYHRNDKEFSIISYIDTLKIQNDLLKTKEAKPDLIIVYYHFGTEYKRVPSKYQRDIVGFTIQNGADIILASHPHLVQPVEFFETVGGRIDTGFVAYSLGNFVSNQRWRFSDSGVILNFSVTKEVDKNKMSLSGFDIVPTWVFKGFKSKRSEYIILPIHTVNSDSTLTYITKDDIMKIKQSRNDTFEIITKYSEKLKRKYLPGKVK